MSLSIDTSSLSIRSLSASKLFFLLHFAQGSKWYSATATCQKLLCQVKPPQKMFLQMIKKYEEKNRGNKKIAVPIAKRKLQWMDSGSSKRLKIK